MKRPYLYAIPVALALAAIATPALATPTEELVLKSGATTVTVLGTGTGIVDYTGPVGNFTVNITAGTAFPAIAPGTFNLISTDNTGALGGTLTILFSQTGYTTAGGPVTAAIAGFAGGTITLTDYYNPGNGLGATTTSCFTSTNTGIFAAGGSCVLPALPLFSLTKFASITEAAKTTTDFNNLIIGNNIRVPEPAILALIGMGLLGFGLTRRKLA